MSLLGIDVGISGCKAVAFDYEGHVLGQAFREYHLYQPQPGWMELDPAEVWAAVSAVVREAAAAAGARGGRQGHRAGHRHPRRVGRAGGRDGRADLPLHHRHRHARGQADAMVGGEGGRQAPLRHHRHAAAPDVHGQQADVAALLRSRGVQRGHALPLHGRLPLHPHGPAAHHGSQPRLPHHAPGHPHAHVGSRAPAPGRAGRRAAVGHGPLRHAAGRDRAADRRGSGPGGRRGGRYRRARSLLRLAGRRRDPGGDDDGFDRHGGVRHRRHGDAGPRRKSAAQQPAGGTAHGRRACTWCSAGRRWAARC